MPASSPAGVGRCGGEAVPATSSIPHQAMLDGTKRSRTGRRRRRSAEDLRGGSQGALLGHKDQQQANFFRASTPCATAQAESDEERDQDGSPVPSAGDGRAAGDRGNGGAGGGQRAGAVRGGTSRLQPVPGVGRPNWRRGRRTSRRKYSTARVGRVHARRDDLCTGRIDYIWVLLRGLKLRHDPLRLPPSIPCCRSACSKRFAARAHRQLIKTPSTCLSCGTSGWG